MLEPTSTQQVRCFRYVAEQQAVFNAQAAPVERLLPLVTPKGSTPLLRLEALKVHFPIYSDVLKRQVGTVKAVDGVSLSIAPGQTLALVGESGCGKTTVGKTIIRLIEETAGAIYFGDLAAKTLTKAELRRWRQGIQFIFQDPYASLNPRMLVLELLTEGLQAQDPTLRRSVLEQKAKALLNQVGLPESSLYRYPHEFSGGQRQRLGIARALALKPQVLVCDEPTSALDVSVQAQILNLLKRLQAEQHLAYLFITHNMGVVEYLADQVAVMYLGCLVEVGRVEQVLQSPQHPYTQSLLAAVPKVRGDRSFLEATLQGDLPSPANPPTGCHFAPRCPHVVAQCRLQRPTLKAWGKQQQVACWQVSADEPIHS